MERTHDGSVLTLSISCKCWSLRIVCFRNLRSRSRVCASLFSLSDINNNTPLSRCGQKIKTHFNYPIIKHILNSAGISRFPDAQFEMVRLGIGLYGIGANKTEQTQLQNVSTLKTTISQIKKIKAGESIGYNRKGIAEKDSVIATVRIGYADGYPRSLSNGIGKMWVNKNLVPVIGSVCMDMTMLDITGVDAKEGDDVIVFGEKLSVAELAEWANTIPYEILTGISQRVKRVYYEE